jgi:glycosyltransferase involved in cell wall biosynthesis
MKTRQLRILFVAPCWPDELAYGTQLRASNIGRALAEMGEVRFVVTEINDNRPGKSGSGSEFNVDRFLPMETIPRRTVRARIRCAFDSRFVNPHGHRVGAADARWLEVHAKDFDLVWFHHLRTANVFERWAWPRSVMDIDDIPSTFLKTVWHSGGNVHERFRAGLRLLAARRRERVLSERFTVLSVCSDADREYLDSNGPVHVIPNGFEAPLAEPVRTPTVPPRVGFIGLFDYLPNRMGIKWFVDQCWPAIKHRVPSAELRLVGRHTDGALCPAGPDIHGLGYLKDPEREMATWSLMVVPIHIGAGTRVKIAEGFSRKIPIVSTSLGAHGYKVQNNVEMLLADKPAEFAACCLQVIENPVAAVEMADRGWSRFQAEWSWKVIKPRVWAAVDECLRISKTGADDRVVCRERIPTGAGGGARTAIR